MLKYKIFLFLLLTTVSSLCAETATAYKFRITLKDKGTTIHTIDNPSSFLSERAIQRRIRQHIPIDETDLPISGEYISELKNLGFEIAATSKWLNTVTVHVQDSILIDQIKILPFVKHVVCVWKNTANTRSSKTNKVLKKLESPQDFYGAADKQIAIHNGDSLHRAGYRGNGMQIAVIDAGFKGFDESVFFENIDVREKKSFIYRTDNGFESAHGLEVMSCMATNVPHFYVGTAPDASYWLFQSENPATEYPVEEDYWVAAAEYADSIGVDLINTSLGYSRFDQTSFNHTIEQLDGKTIFITRGANMASRKGILVVGSAGNEGNKAWRYISAPADSDEILTVGAVRADSILSAFSSRGPTADQRIKPDVVAQGSDAAVVTWDGYTGEASGTSFASPIMCGLAACLWQAFPELTNRQLIQVIKKSANRYDSPDNDYGYGIPDMVKAMRIAKQISTKIEENTEVSKKKFSIQADRNGNISITKIDEDDIAYNIRILSMEGRTVISDRFSSNEKSYQLNAAKNSLYLVNITANGFTETKKIVF